MTVTRRQLREWAVQMLTAADLNPSESVDQVIADFWEQRRTLDEEDGGDGGRLASVKRRAFAEERVRGVTEHLDELDAVIARLLQDGGWDLSRLGTVERAVLRMGVWEMKFTDVPRPVIMNEAVDLANWFSTPKARTLVNGVLSHFAKEI